MSYQVYHRGFLAVDRASDQEVDRIARDYLERATPHGCAVFDGQGEDAPRGRGEGFLTQKKLWDGIYEYRFHPTTHGRRAERLRNRRKEMKT